MAVSLEDKLLGEKAEYYCSSSEDEYDDCQTGSPTPPTAPASASSSRRPAGSSNTGPKGVIEDWRQFKQMQAEGRREAGAMNVAAAKRLTCRSTREDERAAADEEEEEEDVESDEFVRRYFEKRLQQMQSAAVARRPTFGGGVQELGSADAFLKAIDEDSFHAMLLIHLYEPGVEACDTMHGCLSVLAKEHRRVKFCRVEATVLGTSDKFKRGAVPTLQAYKDGQLVGNFVRLQDELGDDFFAADVEAFLQEYCILSENGAVKTTADADSDQSGDFDLD